MSPQLLQFLMFALEEAIQIEPSLVAGFKQLFASGAPTPADFQNLRAQILTPYSAYDPTPLPGAVEIPITILPQPAQLTASPSPAAQSPTPTTAPPPVQATAPSISPAPAITPVSTAAPAPAAPVAAVPQSASTGSASASAATPAQATPVPAAQPEKAFSYGPQSSS
jgi:hypothetical protein